MGSCVVLQKLLEYFYYDEIMMQQTLRLATDGELSDFKDIDLTKIHAMAERRLAMDDGEVFQKHRPRHIKGYEPKAVRKGDKCPDAPVTMMRGDDSTFHAVVREAAATAATVSSKAGEAAPPYVAVLLGSASCPVWQNAVAYLAHVEFGIRGIMVVHVYTKESVPAPRRSSVVVGRPVPTGHPAARSLLGALFTSSSPSVSFSYLFSPFLLGGCIHSFGSLKHITAWPACAGLQVHRIPRRVRGNPKFCPRKVPDQGTWWELQFYNFEYPQLQRVLLDDRAGEGVPLVREDPLRPRVRDMRPATSRKNAKRLTSQCKHLS